MRYSASNIAWPEASDSAAFALLAAAGAKSIEVAPTRVWPDWAGLTPDAIKAYRQQVEDAGLEITSLQSILFQKPDLLLFGDAATRHALAEHLRLCADLAADLGAAPLVFGAPKNRNRGALSEEEAFDSAVAFFKPVGRYFAEKGVALCFEANPEQYACNFITRGSDAARLVRAVDEPGFGLHLDIACTEMSGENVAALIAANIDILQHYHASEPMLGDFAAPVGRHAEAAEALRTAGYTGQVALEMRPQDPPLPALQTAIEFVRNTYARDNEGSVA